MFRAHDKRAKAPAQIANTAIAGHDNDLPPVVRGIHRTLDDRIRGEVPWTVDNFEPGRAAIGKVQFRFASPPVEDHFRRFTRCPAIPRYSLDQLLSCRLEFPSRK